VTAISAAASLLGAPLVNDFAVISLSDLLTPAAMIERRLESAAQADFVIAIYNPKSRNRKQNFSGAVEIIRKYRSENTPVGIVKNASRNGETVIAATLGRIMEYNDIIDMSTIILIGNSESKFARVIRVYGQHCTRYNIVLIRHVKTLGIIKSFAKFYENRVCAVQRTIYGPQLLLFICTFPLKTPA